MLRNSVEKSKVVVVREKALTLLDRRIGGFLVVEDLVGVFVEDDDWLLLLFPLLEEDLKAETAISRENEGKCEKMRVINVFVGNVL